MRVFPYITVGKILEEIRTEGFPKFTRVTFYRLEKRLKFPEGHRTSGERRWRIYSREEADLIKERIKKEYLMPY